MTLKREDFSTDPFKVFQSWYELALSTKTKYPDAMTLATTTLDGTPSARMVLFKKLSQNGICFFTNYQSRKAQEISQNPQAALVFYWSALDRQIRIEGKLCKTSEQESDDYWNSRPRESQLSALASHQSAEIKSRESLESRFFQLQHQWKDQPVPRPAHWGGYCLTPHRFEFWTEGPHRLHDRFIYTRKNQEWTLTQLSP